MGLRAGFVEDGVIDADLWVAAFDMGTLVGLCSATGCGGALKVAPTGSGHAFEVVQGVAWFATRCLRCEREAAFPNGKAARRRPPSPALRRPARSYGAARAALRAMTEEASEVDRRVLGERD